MCQSRRVHTSLHRPPPAMSQRIRICDPTRDAPALHTSRQVAATRAACAPPKPPEAARAVHTHAQQAWNLRPACLRLRCPRNLSSNPPVLNQIACRVYTHRSACELCTHIYTQHTHARHPPSRTRRRQSSPQQRKRADAPRKHAPIHPFPIPPPSTGTTTRTSPRTVLRCLALHRICVGRAVTRHIASSAHSPLQLNVHASAVALNLSSRRRQSAP